MLLNIESSRVPLILDHLIELLDLLEAATGKHKITFGDYLNDSSCEYDDLYERNYIPLFYLKLHLNLDVCSLKCLPQYLFIWNDIIFPFSSA